MDSFLDVILLFLAVISGFLIGFIANDFVVIDDVSSDDCVVDCLNRFNDSYSYDVDGLVNGVDPVLHCDYVCGSYSP